MPTNRLANNSEVLPFVNLFDDGVSIEAPSNFDKDGSAPRKTYMGDGTWKLDFPHGDQLKVSHGLVIQSIQSFGNKKTIRIFTWSKKADTSSHGNEDEFLLSAIEVVKGQYRYHHTRQADGSWKKRTWNKELHCWSEAEPEERSFDFDNKTFSYKFVDASDGIAHIILPGGIEKAITPEGIINEYKNGRLERISKSELVRELKWNGKAIKSLRDDVQQKTWVQTADSVWTSDKGDKRNGDLIFTLNGAFGFREKNKTTFIDMNGCEYEAGAEA